MMGIDCGVWEMVNAFGHTSMPPTTKKTVYFLIENFFFFWCVACMGTEFDFDMALESQAPEIRVTVTRLCDWWRQLAAKANLNVDRCTNEADLLAEIFNGRTDSFGSMKKMIFLILIFTAHGIYFQKCTNKQKINLHCVQSMKVCVPQSTDMFHTHMS